MSELEKFNVQSINKDQTKEWLLYKHYAKRIPVIIYSFGLYKEKELVGVCTYGNPISKDDIRSMLSTVEAEEKEIVDNKSSGKQKLKDLGLTDAEIKALTGA